MIFYIFSVGAAFNSSSCPPEGGLCSELAKYKVTGNGNYSYLPVKLVIYLFILLILYVTTHIAGLEIVPQETSSDIGIGILLLAHAKE